MSVNITDADLQASEAGGICRLASRPYQDRVDAIQS